MPVAKNILLTTKQNGLLLLSNWAVCGSKKSIFIKIKERYGPFSKHFEPIQKS